MRKTGREEGGRNLLQVIIFPTFYLISVAKCHREINGTEFMEHKKKETKKILTYKPSKCASPETMLTKNRRPHCGQLSPEQVSTNLIKKSPRSFSS